jgi:hypothetical protein
MGWTNLVAAETGYARRIIDADLMLSLPVLVEFQGRRGANFKAGGTADAQVRMENRPVRENSLDEWPGEGGHRGDGGGYRPLIGQ